MKYKLFILLFAIGFSAEGQNPLFIPDTLAGPTYNLTMHEDSVSFFPGAVSHTYAFNANHYLGPTLIFNKGTAVTINVTNALNDTTTVHWHGIHLPAIWDGGPYTPILPGNSWHPQFTVKDNAATYWYHPHTDMKTAQQAIKGAAGLIIVRDSVESSLALPRKYGVDDFPLVVQCQQYDSLNQAMPRGMEDSTLLVNGTQHPFLNAPAQMVRLRILNASGERTFNFGFTGNMQFYQIASDGGLLDAPYSTTRVMLAPGERAELVLNLTGMNTQIINLMCYGSEIPMGIQGGPTMPMPPGSPPMDSPLNGIDYNIMEIHVQPQTPNTITAMPAALTTNHVFTAAQATITRTIRFTADSAMVMDGPFYFNDSSFDMMRIDYRIPLNSIEIWKLVNETMVAHPFHLHDVQFYILDRNGNTPPVNEMGRKDVVLIPPGDSIRFITKFTDFTDSITPYMFHCHILMHEDDGMMGNFVVVPNTTNVNELKSNISITVYPNPFSFTAKILFAEEQKNTLIKITDVVGKEIKSMNFNGRQCLIEREEMKAGIYFLNITDENKNVMNRKIIVE